MPAGDARTRVTDVAVGDGVPEAAGDDCRGLGVAVPCRAGVGDAVAEVRGDGTADRWGVGAGPAAGPVAVGAGVVDGGAAALASAARTSAWLSTCTEPSPATAVRTKTTAPAATMAAAATANHPPPYRPRLTSACSPNDVRARLRRR
jgi:hypothetical protein